MTFLRSVRLKGFKTFARTTELEFEPGVTVIIGPNGSGKSNIADAVLWALGEQSPTSLRGRSMQDVIFSGSDGQRPGAVAEVALVFENQAGMFPVDYAQVEISRRLLRDGSSEYRLNGSGCRLLDIQELVAVAGLGREMHSVISQGRVDELVNSTPQTRRSLVEEAAGLGQYKKRRDRAQAKLDKVRVNLDRVSAVEHEVRGALRPLKMQVTAAERFAQATEELAAAQARRALVELVDLRRQIADRDAQLAAVEARRREVDSVLAALRDERAREEERFTAALLERERVSAVFHTARAEAERMRAQAVALEQRSARATAEASRAARRRAAGEEELAFVKARLVALADIPAHSAARLERVSEAARTVVALLGEIRPRFQIALQSEDEDKDVVFESEAARSRLVQEREFLQRQVEEHGLRALEVTAREDEAAAGVAALALVALEGEKEVVEAERRSAELTAAAAEAAMDARRAEETSRTAAADVRAAEATLDALTGRRAVLRDVCLRREGVPEAARAVLAAADDAALVAELLRVRPGYERAVAAALGPLASAVVVSRPRDATVVSAADGPVEVLWPREVGPLQSAADVDVGRLLAGVGSGVAEMTGFVDLWDVVDGPAGLIATLRLLTPPTLMTQITDIAGVRGTPVGLGDAPVGDAPEVRVVHADGSVFQGKVHGARRGEAGAEALLAARAELEGLESEYAATHALVEKVREGASAAVAASAAATQIATVSEAEARGAVRASGAAADDVTLVRRRREDAEARLTEVRARHERDRQLAAGLGDDLTRVKREFDDTATKLEHGRQALRAAREDVEALRGHLSRLEAKRAQATVLEVRLRERLRGQNEECDRVAAQRAALIRVVESAHRQEVALGCLLPTLRDLHAVTEGLAQEVEGAMAGLQQRVDLSRAAGDDFAQALKDHGRREADLQNELSGEAERMVEVQVALAHLGDRAVERERELADLRRRHLAPRQVSETEVEGLLPAELAATEARLQRRLETMGPVNPLAEQEYRETEERASFLAEQRRDLESSLDELAGVIDDLERHIESTFADMFEATQRHFTDMVQLLFPGGRGVLRLEEQAADRPLGDDGEEVVLREGLGIVLEIKPPRKAPRSMSLLSGGEKALAALSFLFALFLARPCPFYVLDEVEAALDDVNLGRFLSLVKRYQDQTQFIIITHQRRTMEIADTLYGVAMDTDGTSRVLSRRLSVAGAGQS